MNEDQQEKRPEIRVKLDDFLYLLNIEEKTASIISANSVKEDLLIPRSINYKSTEYVITNIFDRSFQFSFSKSIRFSEDSELQTVGENVFFGSSIEKFTIPSSLVNLKENWCQKAQSLTMVTIDPSNPRYKIYDEKLIIGKSSLENDEFDVLVFCFRDAENVKIPSFIKRIGASSFYGCKKLKTVEIPSDSELQIIENNAFNNSSIKSFVIPPHLTKICELAFGNCSNLQTIQIDTNSKLHSIEKFAFKYSKVKSFVFPKSLVDLSDEWCGMVYNLDNITIDPSNPRYKLYDDKFIIGKSSLENDEYDVLVFCPRNIKEVKIPSFIKYISPFSFSGCQKLQTVEITSDSELQIIGKSAFDKSSIESFTFPSKLIEIQKKWCLNTIHLNRITVDPSNKRYKLYDDKFVIGKSSLESDEYDVLVFCPRNIKEITIPSFIKHIGFYAFDNCKEIKTIEIPPDSQLQTIELGAFNNASIKSFKIPPQLTKIGEGAFGNCKKLKTVEISENSQLQTIEKCAFSKSSIEYFTNPSNLSQKGESSLSVCKNLQSIEIGAFFKSSIKSITLPTNLTKLGESAFTFCENLRVVNFSSDSKLQIIDNYAFSGTSIVCFTVMPHVTQILEFAFSYCEKLQILEFDENSKIDNIAPNVFYNSSNAIIMIPANLSFFK